jgi:hypothetical protein
MLFGKLSMAGVASAGMALCIFGVRHSSFIKKLIGIVLEA